jgi:hypothetical protein
MNKQTKVNKYGCHEIVRVRQKNMCKGRWTKSIYKNKLIHLSTYINKLIMVKHKMTYVNKQQTKQLIITREDKISAPYIGSMSLKKLLFQ